MTFYLYHLSANIVFSVLNANSIPVLSGDEQSLFKWMPIILRLRLWHIKEVNMVLRPILSEVGRRQTALPPENQLFLCIARSPAFSDFFNIFTFEQFFQAAFYGGFAYVRAKCCNIGFFYNAEFLFKHSFDPFRF